MARSNPLHILLRVQEEEFAEAMLAYFFLAVSPKRITKEGLSILVEDHLKERHRLVVGRV